MLSGWLHPRPPPAPVIVQERLVETRRMAPALGLIAPSPGAASIPLPPFGTLQLNPAKLWVLPEARAGYGTNTSDVAVLA